MQRGDVVWTRLPRPGDALTHEQFGSRPAVVMQDEPAFSLLATVLVVPLTSKVNALRFPGTMLIQPSPQNGLPTQSVALAFNLTAIDRRRIERKMGCVSATVMSSLENEVRKLLRIG